jgi:predicted transcriptional regulator
VYNVRISESATLTIRLPKEDLDRLEVLAHDTRRSRSYLAAEAIGEYLKYKEWKIQAVKEGIASAERGEWVSDEAVDAWLASWGTDHELPPPEIGD